MVMLLSKVESEFFWLKNLPNYDCDSKPNNNNNNNNNNKNKKL